MATLNDRHLLVIGAGPGIGAATARRFGQEGHRVTLASRDGDALAKLAEDVSAAVGVSPDTLVVDAADPAGLRSTLTAWAEAGGTPDTVLYNAATLRQDVLVDLEPDDLLRTLAANATGAVAAAQAVRPAMRQAGRGTILLTGGGLALAPAAAYGSVSLGKAALRSVALVLAQDLAPEGIHVATATVTAFVQPGTAASPDVIAQRYWEVVHEPAGSWTIEFLVPVGEGAV